MNATLLLERDGAIATLTLNRPASLNALDSEMIDALIAHSGALAADDSVRCVVIKGAGRHFMAVPAADIEVCPLKKLGPA